MLATKGDFMCVSKFWQFADFVRRFDTRKGFSMTKRILFFSTAVSFVLLCGVARAEQNVNADKNSNSPNEIGRAHV